MVDVNAQDIDVVASPLLQLAFAEYLQRLTIEESRMREAECKLALSEAENLERDKKFTEAGKRFADAIDHLLGQDVKIPIDATNDGGVRFPVYLKLTMDECLTAMTCANAISRCMFETGRLAEALDWTMEVDVLHKNARFASPPLFDWEIYHPPASALEFHRQRIMGLLTAADVYVKLGNTGAAAYCRNLANDIIGSLPSLTDQHVFHQELLSLSTFRSALQLRHPDPSISRTHEVTDPALQVRGSWQKLRVQVHSRIASRMAHACFIYKSRLYVCGGQRSGTLEVYNDLWCLDLNRMDGWRELPSYSRPFLNCEMVVHAGKAYLFRGFSSVDYFDLERERWGRVQTHFLNARGGRDEWPWSDVSLSSYATCVVRGHMYVFAGKHRRHIGCNLFAVLDIERRTWTRLSGTTDREPLLPSHDVPGVRHQLACWVDGREERIYVMYGMADRQAAQLYNEEFGGPGFACDDCWSWDIARREWRRERVAGNIPCPRAEMSVCYNKKIDSTIMFGGYSPALPFYADIGAGIVYGYNYFADTFILDLSAPAPRWRQVITPSFPTYRAQGQLLADEATGKMYLFGGYTNTDWVPAGKSEVTRSYGDIWQLVVDVAGGLFEGVDWEDEKRAAQLGPWQVCYMCNSVGIHKKCGGSCGGRVFYCTPKCQKDGWPEHKEKHGCRR